VNLRLFLHVCSLEARTRMAYRVDFWINALVGFAVEFAVVWFLWDAVFRASETSLVGGRDFEQTITYYLGVLLLGRFIAGRDAEGAVSNDIYEGGLNRYLVFPVAYGPYKYAEGLGRLAPVVVQILGFGAAGIALLSLS